MRIESMLLVVGFAVPFFLSAGQELHWDASVKPTELGNGALAFSYDDANRVKRIDVNPTIDGPVTVSGDTIDFAEDAKICLTGEGTATFDLAATAPAGLTLDSTLHNLFSSLSWSKGSPLLRDEAVEIPEFAQVDLSQYRLETMPLNTAGLSNVYIVPNTPGHPCHQVVSNFEGRTFLDAQIHNDVRDATKWLKCIKVRLVQDGSRITAQVLWAKYADRTQCGEDFDFENPGEVELLNMAIPATLDDKGYTVDALNLSRISAGSSVRCVFRQPIALTGPFVITNSVTVEARGPQGLFPDGSSIENDLSIFSGRLEFTDRDNVLLGSHILGRQGTVMFRNDDSHEPLESLVFRYSNPDAADPAKLADGSWHVFLRNARLSAVTNIASRLTSTGAGLNGNETVSLFHYRNDGLAASVEVQNYYIASDGGLVRAATIELRQNGDDIEIRRSRTYYQRSVNRDVFDAGGVTYENAPNKSGSYEPTKIDLFCREDPRFRRMSVTLSGANDCTNGGLVFGVPNDAASCYEISIAHTSGFPANGTVDVYGGASKMTIKHDTMVSTTGTGWSSTVNMHEGATLAVPDTFRWGAKGPRLVMEGGLAQLRKGNDTGAVNYANQMTLRGATLDGAILFCGFGPDGVWHVEGEQASSVTAGEIRTASAATQGTWVLDVADVTGDGAADLTIDAPITLYTNASNPSLYPDSRIVKRGSGSVSLTKSLATGIASVRVTEGALVLGSDQVFSSANDNLVLDGGALEVKAGIAASVGAVKVRSDSAITLGEGASLCLAAQPEAEWSAEELAISGPQKPGHSIRFGTSPSALTMQQVKKIRYNGKQVRLDKDGYLLTEPFGLMVIFK